MTPVVPAALAAALPIPVERERVETVMNQLSKRLWALEVHRRLEIRARDVLA